MVSSMKTTCDGKGNVMMSEFQQHLLILHTLKCAGYLYAYSVHSSYRNIPLVCWEMNHYLINYQQTPSSLKRWLSVRELKRGRGSVSVFVYTARWLTGCVNHLPVSGDELQNKVRMRGRCQRIMLPKNIQVQILHLPKLLDFKVW